MQRGGSASFLALCNRQFLFAEKPPLQKSGLQIYIEAYYPYQIPSRFHHSQQSHLLHCYFPRLSREHQCDSLSLPRLLLTWPRIHFRIPFDSKPTTCSSEFRSLHSCASSFSRSINSSSIQPSYHPSRKSPMRTGPHPSLRSGSYGRDTAAARTASCTQLILSLGPSCAWHRMNSASMMLPAYGRSMRVGLRRGNGIRSSITMGNVFFFFFFLDTLLSLCKTDGRQSSLYVLHVAFPPALNTETHDLEYLLEIQHPQFQRARCPSSSHTLRSSSPHY